MISVKKTATLALAILFAVSLLEAIPAQAALEFESLETVTHGESEEEGVITPATLDATEVAGEPLQMSLGGLPVKCETATASASLGTGASPTLTLSPTYGKCKVSLFGLPAEVIPGSCGLAVHGLAETAADAFSAQLDVTCPAKGEILVVIKNFAGTKTTCLIHVRPQSNLKTVKVSNMTEASPEGFTVKTEIESLVVEVTKGEENCLIAPGTYTNAKYTANTTVTSTGSGATPPITAKPKARVEKVTWLSWQWEDASQGVIGTNVGDLQFSFAAGTVTCAGSTWENAFNGPHTTRDALSTQFDFEACKFEKTYVEFTIGKCAWYLDAGAIEGTSYIGGLNLSCNMIPSEVHLPNCIISVNDPVYIPRGHRWASYENLGAGKNRQVKATLDIWGIEYEEVGTGCKTPNKPQKNGTLKGTLLFEGRNYPYETESRGVWIGPKA